MGSKGDLFLPFAEGGGCLFVYFFFWSSSLAASPVSTLPSASRTILKSLYTPVPVTSFDWPRANPTLSIAVLMDQ